MEHFSLRVCALILGGVALGAGSAALAQVPGPGEVVAADGLPFLDPEVLTPNEAALLLRVELATLLDLAQTGEIPARQLGGEWRFSRAAVLGWLAGDRQELALANADDAIGEPHVVLRPLTTQTATAVVGRGLSGAAQVDQMVTAPQSTETDAPIGTAPKGRTASEVFLRDQRIVLAPNEVTLDFGVSYARNDALALVDAGNGPTLGSVESGTSVGILAGRYSVGRATELFASTSYRNQQVAIFADGQSLSRASRGDFGDIGLGLRRTIIDEGPGRPDVIVTLEGSIPTGASSYSVGGGLTLVKSFDPAVLFGSVNYRHSFSRDFADITRLQPRDRIDAQIGYAFALNDTVILNTALSGSFNFATTFDDAAFRQNETFNLLLGLTARVSRNLFVQPSVSYRLNGLGNGVAFGLNFPYTLGL